ncbi:MAG: GNAT family N-acetyltransferase [Candidatus Daviesbacteria bacterium]|nr:MAG: GNAT family N-acetyltransferase [Candidatus Daviesbacteria bacterium]
MKIELVTVRDEEKHILANLLELYEYDFSEFSNSDLDENGRYGYKYLDNYWQEENRHPFFIKVDDKLAGFVLVNKHTYLSDDANAIAEFFILKKYRRGGIGSNAAKQIFDMFPGKWEVTQTNQNKDAQKFWNKVVNEYTNGNYKEVVLDNEKWKGPVLTFDN